MKAEVVWVDPYTRNDTYVVSVNDGEHKITFSDAPGPDWYCSVHQAWDCMMDLAVREAAANALYPQIADLDEDGYIIP